ncbi:MAG: hypothetical protein ACRD2N_07140 [Vicinamibacterales bacterium]
MIVFTSLFAAIHWNDDLRDRRALLSPLINTLPLLILTCTAPFPRRQSSANH